MAQAKSRKGKSVDQGSASKEEMRRKSSGDEGKQSQTSDKGLRARADQAGFSGRFQGSSGRSREDEDLTTLSNQAVDSANDLKSLQQEEISGSQDEDISSVNYSDTDEDEDEGLGDGNLGRTVRGSDE